MAFFGAETKHHVMLILFFSYIYDAIRMEFIESRHRRRRNLQPLIIVTRKTSRDNPPNRLTDQSDKLVDSSWLYEQSAEQSNHLKKPEEVGWMSASKKRFFKLLRMNGSFRRREGDSYKNQTSPEDQNMDVDDEFLTNECPLQEMPKVLRIYQIFSTIFIIYLFLKYILVCTLKYRLINVDPIYLCYVPGRVSFLYQLAYELPIFTLFIISYHVIYRYLWCVKFRRINMDCFMFVICDGNYVQEKARQLHKLQLETVESKKIFIKDRMFYQKISLTRYRHRYILKSNRTIDHWIEMRKFINRITYFCLINFAIFGGPLFYVIATNLFSDEYFNQNYDSCRSFARAANDTNFQWSFSEPYRAVYFVFDGVENILLLLDSSCGLTWPFTAAIISTHDLTLKLSNICKRLVDLQDRIDKCILKFRLKNVESEVEPIPLQQSIQSQDKDLETDILVLQNEIVETFEQIAGVDKFMKRFAAFCIFCWVTMNICYQVVSLLVYHVIKSHFMVIFLQVFGVTILTFTFSHLGRTYSKAVRMYHLLCGLMARDQNFKTSKQSWIWILEYYNEHDTRFTLHLGSRSTLSMLNYIKGMVWLLSGTLIILNLIKYQ